MNSFLRKAFSWWVGRKLLIASVIALAARSHIFGQVANQHLQEGY